MLVACMKAVSFFIVVDLADFARACTIWLKICLVGNILSVYSMPLCRAATYLGEYMDCASAIGNIKDQCSGDADQVTWPLLGAHNKRDLSQAMACCHGTSVTMA